ncbi:putative cell wall protein [Durio zibethinus]|uniref:Cell wall protein n=1 Tax=Durio zibethinus TaxID=66656 RepID=A0A6P6AGW9_DURZI|nr:putative cell wall protein [Durio zibethinus]
MESSFNSPPNDQPTRLNLTYKKRYSLPSFHHPRATPISSLSTLNSSLVMAYKFSSLLLCHIFIVNILLAIAGQATATRDIPSNPKNDDQMKQPEWLIEHDRSVLIPGIGRVMLPPVLKPHNPYTGGNIGSTIGGTGYIPGGDDTFVPNPGFEVPIPGHGAGTAGTYPYP